MTNPITRNKYCFIYVLKFTNLRSINPNTYISVSKSDWNGDITKDNGRVINCYGELFYTCTCADFDIINMLYEWDKLDVLDSYYARAEHLPRKFLDYVLTLYSDKTTLKGVKGQEDFYQQQKGFLNSLYGMTVTSLIPDECILEGDNWVIKTPSEEEIKSKLKQMGQKNKDWIKSYFLGFSWGVFCTAYSRRNLFSCALGYSFTTGTQHNGTENGYNCLYFDTDSIFCIGRPDYTWYNTEILQKLENCCKIRNLDSTKLYPRDIKGNVHPLGIFDAEEDIKKFKCIHAKCYLEQRFDNELYLTISGINKGAVKCLKSMDDFKPDFVFDKDSQYVKKLIPTYCENQPVITYPDGYISKYKYGKNLRATGYKISITDEYEQLLQAYKLTFDDLSAEQIIAFKKDIV